MAAQDRGGSERILLDVSDLSIRFGGITALDSVSMRVRDGDICGIIGPNGAGKTTFFNCLCRLYDYSSGSIRIDGEDVGAMPRHRVAAAGIGRTFQNLALFNTLSVMDNIMTGAHCWAARGYLSNMFRTAKVVAKEEEIRAHAVSMARLVGIEPLLVRPVSELTFGMRKKVELARALMVRPRLLLLDEPAAGLNHAEVELLRELILHLRDQMNLTVLLVEHHMNLVMRVSDEVVALNFGRKITQARPDEVQRNPEVIQSYLGG